MQAAQKNLRGEAREFEASIPAPKIENGGSKIAILNPLFSILGYLASEAFQQPAMPQLLGRLLVADAPFC
jgi:hypothetical protein